MPIKKSSMSILAMTNQGAVRRIRSPTTSDVLLGRGGGINGHFGNKVFREWVRVRKEEYNLAPNKAEKTRVATEVMNQVKAQAPPGRFLQRDPTAGPPGWWVEVDGARALAKTSQALREGAPQIRAAHKTEVRGTRKRKASKMATTAQVNPMTQTDSTASPTPSGMVGHSWPPTVPARVATGSRTLPETRNARNEQGRSLNEARSPPLPAVTRPLMSNQEFQQTFSKPSEEHQPTPSKRVRSNPSTDAQNVPIDYYGETPPLTSAPAAVPMQEIPVLNLNTPPRSSSNLKRSNSLALSDFSEPIEIDYEFVNPFSEENELFLSSDGDVSQTLVPLPPRETPLRSVSTDEGREDYRSMAELYDFPTQSPPIGDFNEEVKTVLDAVQAEGDLTAPYGLNNKHNDYAMPTLLIPWRGGVLKRRYSSSWLANANSPGGKSSASSSHRVLGDVQPNKRQ